MRPSYIFTSESVSEGHPDKVADRISDVVVDAFLSKDPEARVACETMVTTNRIILAGEVRADDNVIEDIIGGLEHKVRHAVKDIGYAQKGFHWAAADYACHLHAQSADIAMGVDAGDDKDEGAGDQGIMFGYATDETAEFTLKHLCNGRTTSCIVWHRPAIAVRPSRWNRMPNLRSRCCMKTVCRAVS